MKKLTIGIPTYNRGNKVVSLLYFLDKELQAIEDQNEIEIIISDNCSSDNTYSILSRLKEDHLLSFDYRLNRNETNEGIIGNQIVLHNLAQGDYLWIMGDDDIYHSGIVKRVYQEVVKYEYSFIFINYCRYKEKIGDECYVASILEGIDMKRTDSNVLLDITKKFGGGLMYISAAIHKTCFVKELQHKGWDINLAYPLLMSYYSASKGKVKLIEDVLIDDVLGDISWSDKLAQVFNFDVPYCMRKTIELNYDKESVKTMYDNYMNVHGLPYSFSDFLLKLFQRPKWGVRWIVKSPIMLFKLISANRL